MKRSIGLALFIVSAAMETAWGATYTWGYVGSDWATAANWKTNAVTSSTVPGVNDTAVFGNNAANPPVISGAQSIYKVDCSGQNNAMTFGGSGTLTIGAGGILGQTYGAVTFTNTLTLNLSASQPWRPTSGRTMIVQGPITGTGDITVNNASDLNCVLKYGGAPSYVTNATFVGNLVVNGPAVQRQTYQGNLADNTCQFWLDFGTIAADTTATFGQTAGAAPGTNTLNGASFYIAATASSGAPIAECNNPISIASGGGALLSCQKSGAIGKWSGPITLGGPLYLACDLGSSTITYTNLYTGTISLNQNAAGRLSIANLPNCYYSDNITFLGGISDWGR